VRGIFSDKVLDISENVDMKNFLSKEELLNAFLASQIVICRSGYSTLMELAALGKKAILIPTPGQTEQEYLAEYFFKKKIFYSAKQSEFDLKKAIGSINLYKKIFNVRK
jgi:UDP-N-acetylglucosamine:LPS N-acetylglucosamine transferase